MREWLFGSDAAPEPAIVDAGAERDVVQKEVGNFKLSAGPAPPLHSGPLQRFLPRKPVSCYWP